MSLEGARILVSGVVLGQPMGGVRRHNAELLPRLAKLLGDRGARLSILEGSETLGFSLPAEIERVHCEVPAGPPLARALAEGRAVRAVLRAAREQGEPYSLFHTAHLPVPRRLEVPLTLTIHDLRRLDPSHADRLKRATSRFALQRAVQAAERVFCVSESVRSELATQFALAKERVHLVPNAADHFTPLARAATPEPSLLHIGHLEPRKNLELLLRAVALDPSLPDITLAGAAKGEEGERLRRIAAELGIESRVRFLGPVSEAELPSLLAAAACVVIPSRIEGFGIGVLEAQRAGVPLAVSSIAALREVAGEATPYFSPESPAECARAIRAALAADTATLEAARKSAERYSWDTSARAWFDAWEAIIRA